MKIGVHLPQWGISAGRSGVLDAARAAEDAGFDSVWVADHVVHPLKSATAYPYRSGGLPFGPTDGFLEAITTLAVVAGSTSRIQLGTSVFVLPMREPLLAAKSLATLDVLSEGRTVVAVGTGWWEEEFAALQVPFAARGRRLDEQIRILRHAWNDPAFAFHGEFYDFAELACLPHPFQLGGVPVLIGGMGTAALRRAGTLGDGWHAVGANIDQLVAGRPVVDRAARAAGRDPGRITLSTSCGLGRTTEQSIERMSALARVGVDHVTLNVGSASDDVRTLCKEIENFASNVMPELELAKS